MSSVELLISIGDIGFFIKLVCRKTVITFRADDQVIYNF